MTSLGLELQVWFGICFKPFRAHDPHCPPLPSWIAKELDSRGPDAVCGIMASCGYAADNLTWLCYESAEGSYWGMAVTGSVQRSMRWPGTVDTTCETEVAQRWIDSLGQAAQILDLPLGTRFDWYHTSSMEPAHAS